MRLQLKPQPLGRAHRNRSEPVQPGTKAIPMSSSQFLARQLGNPSKVVGRFLAPMWNKRNQALHDATFASLALDINDRVLEVGSGGGSLLGRIASVTTEGVVVGVDISPAMISYCTRRHRPLIDSGRLALACASADAIPYPDCHFNKICTVNSVFYWPNVFDALAEFRRLLEVSGTFVMCFTCRSSLQRKRFAEHIRLYEPQDIADMMTSSGFQNLHQQLLLDRHRQFVCITAS
jgi:SAM-dependent methyltransferase